MNILRMKCESCGKFDHTIHSCPLILFFKYREKFIEKQLKQNHQSRVFAIRRKKQKIMNSLWNKSKIQIQNKVQTEKKSSFNY